MLILAVIGWIVAVGAMIVATVLWHHLGIQGDRLLEAHSALSDAKTRLENLQVDASDRISAAKRAMDTAETTMAALRADATAQSEQLAAAQKSLTEAQDKLARLEADAERLEKLVQTALPIVKSLDTETQQSGEWKFHQAFARVAPLVDRDKWRAGWAIHEALARIRMEK